MHTIALLHTKAGLSHEKNPHPLEYRAKSAGYVFFFARSPLAPMTTMLRVMSLGIFPSNVSRRLHMEARDCMGLFGWLFSFSNFGGEVVAVAMVPQAAGRSCRKLKHLTQSL